MRRQRLFLVGVGMLCLACLLAACAKEKRVDERAQRLAELEATYNAVAALETATQAKIDYEAYAKMVPEASAAVRAYAAPDDASRAIAAHLSAAIYSHQNAVRAWATKYDECEDCAWRKFVSAHPQFALEDADAEYAVTVLWNTASGELKAAKEALANYKGG